MWHTGKQDTHTDRHSDVYIESPILKHIPWSLGIWWGMCSHISEHILDACTATKSQSQIQFWKGLEKYLLNTSFGGEKTNSDKDRTFKTADCRAKMLQWNLWSLFLGKRYPTQFVT